MGISRIWMMILTIEEKHLFGYVNVKKKLEIACVICKAICCTAK